MSVRVRVEFGQDQGRTWRLGRVGAYVIGRHPASSIRILDMKVSKEHCRVRVVQNGGAKALLGDLGSTHGTLLNGQPMPKEKEHELKPGDEIRLGSTVLRVLGDGTADLEAAPSSPDLPAGATMVPEGTKNGPAAASPRRKTFAPDELVGKEIAGYRVIEKIGQGGMGAVYRAEQLSLHREVALKVLSEKFTTDNAFVDQFVNEARAAGALNHPNVVQVYDVGQENGRFFFSMEFVSGGSVEDRLKDGKPADWREALNWFLDAANALIFATKRGILHRDVKPDNLMIAENGSAKLCDLGLAKKSESADLLAQGIIGTPHFISPEAVRRKKDIDARSDLYSLGCTFYRVFTAQNPYQRDSVKDILMAQLKDPVPRVSAKNPDVPKDLDDVVFRLMQKEPEQRFQTPEELYQALDKIRLQFGLEAHGIKTGGGKKVLAIAAVLVLAAAAAVVYAVTRPEKVKPKTEDEIRAEQEREEAAERMRLELAQREYDNFKLESGGALALLDVDRAKAGADEPPEAYEALAKRYDAFAEGLEKHEKYADRPEVVQMGKDARKAADEIREYSRVLNTVKKEIDEARAQHRSDLETKLKAARTAYDEAVAKKQWAAAVAAVSPEAIEAIAAPFRERRVADILPKTLPEDTRRRFQEQPLLNAEKDVDAKVKEALGDPPGKELGEKVLAAMKTDLDEQVAQVDAELGKKNVEGYEKALELLEALLGGLPPAPNPDAPAGSVEHALGGYLTEARARRDAAQGKLNELRAQELHADAKAYWELLRVLRQPGVGLLYLYDFGTARVRLEGDAKKVKVAKYGGFVAERLEDVVALQRLFERAAQTFPTWAVDKVDVADGDKTRSVKVKAVTPQGITVGAEEQKWSEWPLGWVLDALFFAGAEQPRFPFDAQDHRALANLAEMAGRFDLAKTHWDAYLKEVPADAARTREVVGRRVAELPKEQRIADAFRRAVALLREVEAFVAHYEALDAQGKFDKEARERCLAERAAMNKRLQDLGDLLQVDLQDAALLTTTWAAALHPAFPGADYGY